jgi:REP element-mobilizing transposase RayT
MSKKLPVRKHPRLKGFDYSSAGAYYITFCVKDRHEMLGRIVGRDAPGAPFSIVPDAPLSHASGVPLSIVPDAPLSHASGVPLSDPGVPFSIASSTTLSAPGTTSVELTEYGKIISKEIAETHLHYKNIVIDKFVVMPNHIHMIVFVRNENDEKNGAPGASRPTAAIIPNIVGVLKRKTNKAYGFRMWQDSYHDHIIRDETDYQRIWQYIDENPARWAEDDYYKEPAACQPLGEKAFFGDVAGHF